MRYTLPIAYGAGVLLPGSPLQSQAPSVAPENAPAPALGPAALSLYSGGQEAAQGHGLSHGAAGGIAGKHCGLQRLRKYSLSSTKLILQSRIMLDEIPCVYSAHDAGIL